MLATHPLLSLAAMRTRDRATTLMLSLLLPLAAVALLVAFSVGTVVLAEQDRAIVWAQGTPAQLAEMQRKVLANPWFGNGRSALPSAHAPLPAACGASAREFSFASLRSTDGQAAREILELIAAQTGAQVCVTDLFIVNELPDASQQSWLQEAASTVLLASLLPCAAVVLLYALMADKLGLATLLGDRGRWTNHVAWGLGAGAAASLLMALGHHFAEYSAGVSPSPPLTLQTVGFPLAFALLVSIPVMSELAFRGWMQTIAERGIGVLPAAALTAGVFAAANLPEDAWGTVGFLGLGALLSALYLRTRSLLACMLAHVQVSAWAFCLG